MSEKIYRVQMNSKGMPNFSTAVEVADRPQGEWVEAEEDWRHQIEFWKCSECGFAVSSRYNYCPNCGARMKGADDE